MNNIQAYQQALAAQRLKQQQDVINGMVGARTVPNSNLAAQGLPATNHPHNPVS